MVDCTWNSPKTVQLLCLVASAFVIVASILRMVLGMINPILVINCVFTLLFGLVLLCAELYVFPFFGYFTFIVTSWGKTFMYFFMGFLMFDKGGFGIVVAIVCWILAVLLFIAGFIVKATAPPYFQKGGPPDLQVTSVYEISAQ